MEMQRKNPFEIALWVLSVVLIVGSVVALYAVASTYFGVSSYSCSGEDVCDEQILSYLYQIVFSAAPGVIASGFGCAAIALGVRAIDINALRRVEHVELAADAGIAETIQDPRPAPVQQIDPSLFMRPRD